MFCVDVLKCVNRYDEDQTLIILFMEYSSNEYLSFIIRKLQTIIEAICVMLCTFGSNDMNQNIPESTLNTSTSNLHHVPYIMYHHLL